MKRYTGIVGVFAFVFGLLWVSEPEPVAAQVSLSRGGQISLIATGTITATQVRKLNATPVEVIAAPASGNAIILESVRIMLDWNSIVYDNVASGEDVRFQYSGAGNALGSNVCDEATCINANGGADQFGYVTNAITVGINLNQSAVAVDITILGGEWANTDADSDGDSPLHYFIRYRVVTLDLS